MNIYDSLASMARYNGWHSTLCDIRNYLIKEVMRHRNEKYYTVSFPEFLSKYDVDSYPRVIWFIMVEMFGNCGTSPRFGWIEIDKAIDAIDFISGLCLQGSESGEG